MKKFLFITAILTIFFESILLAQNNFFYINIDYIVNESKAGKNILKKITKEVDDFKIKSEKKRNNIKDKEVNAKAQKKIIAEEEYVKIIKEIRTDIINFKNENKIFYNDVNSKKTKELNKLINKINPILARYAENNSIDMIFNKSSIILGKKEFDITNIILEIVNKEIK